MADNNEWSSERTKELRAYFGQNIKDMRVPGKNEINKFMTDITRFPLNNMDWLDVKNKLNAEVQREKRNKRVKK